MTKLSMMGLGVFLVSASAMAMPAVGDLAEFDATVTQGTTSATGTVSMELTAFDGTNYNEKVTTNFNGSANSQNQAVEASKLATDALIDRILANCAAVHGTLEHVTVAAGGFDTCAVPQENDTSKGTVWIGKVTFGVVKQSSTDKASGRVINIELKNYHNG